MLIKNTCIENNEELKCIRIEDGKFKEIKKKFRAICTRRSDGS